MYLGECEICKKLCDTGCLIPYDDKDIDNGAFCICLDCSDETPPTELKQIISKIQQEHFEKRR